MAVTGKDKDPISILPRSGSTMAQEPVTGANMAPNTNQAQEPVTGAPSGLLGLSQVKGVDNGKVR